MNLRQSSPTEREEESWRSQPILDYWMSYLFLFVVFFCGSEATHRRHDTTSEFSLGSLNRFWRRWRCPEAISFLWLKTALMWLTGRQSRLTAPDSSLLWGSTGRCVRLSRCEGGWALCRRQTSLPETRRGTSDRTWTEGRTARRRKGSPWGQSPLHAILIGCFHRECLVPFWCQPEGFWLSTSFPFVVVSRQETLDWGVIDLCLLRMSLKKG